MYTFPELKNITYVPTGLDIDSNGKLFAGMYGAGIIAQVNTKLVTDKYFFQWNLSIMTWIF